MFMHSVVVVAGMTFVHFVTETAGDNNGSRILVGFADRCKTTVERRDCIVWAPMACCQLFPASICPQIDSKNTLFIKHN